MIQQVLAEPEWAGRLNARASGASTRLIYGHVNPYGSFLLDLHSRLPIEPPRFSPQPVGTQRLLAYDQLTGLTATLRLPAFSVAACAAISRRFES